jgi:hypothetical protein
VKNVSPGYSLKLTSIGSSSWQLFITKLDESSDYVRVVYGITEQVGGGARIFKILRSYILTPQADGDPVFMFQFNEQTMKNRRVWAAFETVKRNKGKRGEGLAAYIALSPTQSKWRTAIGSTTNLDIQELSTEYFKRLYAQEKTLPEGVTALLDA